MYASIITGQDCKVYINNVLLGYVSAVQNWTIESDYRESREIDSNLVKELIPGQYKVTGTLQVLRGRDTGGLEGAGLIASGSKMLLQKYCTISIVDRLTDQHVFKATKAQITRQSWTIAPRQLVTGSFSFIATDFENEAKS